MMESGDRWTEMMEMEMMERDGGDDGNGRDDGKR